MIRVGVVARPHGVRGAIAVTLDDPSSTTLHHVDHVFLGASEDDAAARRIAVRRGGTGRKGQALLELEGVGSFEAADGLRGLWVMVERGQLPPLGAGEYLQRDLLGLRAVDAAGAELGAVAEIVDTASVPILVVRGEGAERYVPFTEDHVLAVDVPGGTIRVAPPPVEEA
jgi:16S rRNA processing protein RimM